MVMQMITVSDVILSIIMAMQSVILYKIIELSSRVTRVEEDIKWIIKWINHNGSSTK